MNFTPLLLESLKILLDKVSTTLCNEGLISSNEKFDFTRVELILNRIQKTEVKQK